MAGCFPQEPRWCLSEQVWILRYIRTCLYFTFTILETCVIFSISLLTHFPFNMPLPQMWTCNNINDFFCASIIEDQAQWHAAAPEVTNLGLVFADPHEELTLLVLQHLHLHVDLRVTQAVVPAQNTHQCFCTVRVATHGSFQNSLTFP